MRVPVVLGLGRRSGASTVAAALHATECLRPPLVTRGPRFADIAVCAGDDAALGSAEAVLGAAVLLVVPVDDTTPPTPARQQELARRHGCVVVLPHVPEWAGLSGVPDDAEALFARPPEQLPPALITYARGLRLAVAALLRSDVLSQPRPSTLTWSPPTTWSTPPSGRPRPVIRRAFALERADAPIGPLLPAPPIPAHDRPRATSTGPSPGHPSPTRRPPAEPTRTDLSPVGPPPTHRPPTGPPATDLSLAGPPHADLSPTHLSPTGPPVTGRAPATAAPVGPTAARPAPVDLALTNPAVGAAPAPVLDDDAIEAEVLAAATHGSDPAAARRPPAAATPTPAPPAAPLRIRARHRPVMGPVRAENAKAG